MELKLLQYAEDKGRQPDTFSASNEDVNDFLAYVLACEGDSPEARSQSSSEAGDSDGDRSSGASSTQLSPKLPGQQANMAEERPSQVCLSK